MNVSFRALRTTVASSTHLAVPVILILVLMAAAALRSPQLFSANGIAGAMVVCAPLIFATLALTPIALAGRGGVDLSIGPLIGFINVTLIQWLVANRIESMPMVLAYVIGVGVLYQLLQGLIIVYVRVAPIIVSLSGYLVLSGLNLVILPRPSGVAPEWMASWGAGTDLVSPITIVLLIGFAAWFLFSRTAFFSHLRMTGADERTAFTSGVRTDIVRLGAHVASGVFAGLGALVYTAMIGSGDPTQGSTYTLSAVTALVLGGTSLAGGRGGGFGSVVGAINMYLISYVLATFDFGSASGFVMQMSYGVILVISLLISVVCVSMFKRGSAVRSVS